MGLSFAHARQRLSSTIRVLWQELDYVARFSKAPLLTSPSPNRRFAKGLRCCSRCSFLISNEFSRKIIQPGGLIRSSRRDWKHKENIPGNDKGHFLQFFVDIPGISPSYSPQWELRSESHTRYIRRSDATGNNKPNEYLSKLRFIPLSLTSATLIRAIPESEENIAKSMWKIQFLDE